MVLFLFTLNKYTSVAYNKYNTNFYKYMENKIKEITFNTINVKELLSFLNRMLNVENSIYLNLNSETLSSNVYTPNKNLAKTFNVPLIDIFGDGEINDEIKISFYDGKRVVNAFSYFDENTINLTISYINIDDEYYADKVYLSDDKLNITLNCQDLSLGFINMTPEQKAIVFGVSDKVYDFDLFNFDLQKIKKLSKFDSDQILTFYSNNDGIHIKTSTFDIIIDSTFKDIVEEKSIFKEYFDKLDNEDYSVTVCKNKFIFNSKDSNVNVAMNNVVI